MYGKAYRKLSTMRSRWSSLLVPVAHVRRMRTTHLALRASSTGGTSVSTPVLPPRVESLSNEEFRNSVAGGGSALNIGEFGEAPARMHAFWRARGVSPALAINLAERAASRGGVWGDPPTLHSRLTKLVHIMATTPLERLMSKYPQIVEQRPETVYNKLQALSAALPGNDILAMVARMPAYAAAFFCTAPCFGDRAATRAHEVSTTLH